MATLDQPELRESLNKILTDSRPRLERVMGTHRPWEHVTQCYLLGSPAQIRARIQELAAAGLEYIVLSPLDYDPGQLDLWHAEIVRHFPD